MRGIIFTSEQALADLCLILKSKLDLVKYRQMMSHPMWSYLLRAVVHTRSYEEGIEGGLLLLRFTEENRHILKHSEYEANQRRLYRLILIMLDKLDRWEDYLQVWESLFRNKKLEMTYARGSEKFHGVQMEPFIMREVAATLYVHFLWGTHHRKALIASKLARKRNGKKIGNLLHASPAELTSEERKRRVRRIVEIIKTINPSFR